MQGLVHIYTGNGKGKTSAAIGLGVRAYGNGLTVFMAQFLKGIESGEVAALKKLEPEFVLYRNPSLKKFTWEMNALEIKESKTIQEETFDIAKKAIFCGKWNVVILDEIFAAINLDLVKKVEVINIIKNKPEDLELVMTGRNAPEELVNLADYVSEIIQVKHPLNNGIKARKGIEF